MNKESEASKLIETFGSELAAGPDPDPGLLTANKVLLLLCMPPACSVPSTHLTFSSL